MFIQFQVHTLYIKIIIHSLKFLKNKVLRRNAVSLIQKRIRITELISYDSQIKWPFIRYDSFLSSIIVLLNMKLFKTRSRTEMDGGLWSTGLTAENGTFSYAFCLANPAFTLCLSSPGVMLFTKTS